jgi:hypothetical protein
MRSQCRQPGQKLDNQIHSSRSDCRRSPFDDIDESSTLAIVILRDLADSDGGLRRLQDT